MTVVGHRLGQGGELGNFTQKEVVAAVAKTEGEEPKHIKEGFEVAFEAAKHDKENRELLRIVRSSAESLLNILEEDPKSLDMLLEPYINSVMSARKQMGRAEDEEGVRMMLGAAIKAIGDRRGIANNDVLMNKIAGSVELVKEWVGANAPKQEDILEFTNKEDKGVGLTDEEIDAMLIKLDKMIDPNNRPSGEGKEERV